MIYEVRMTAHFTYGQPMERQGHKFIYKEEVKTTLISYIEAKSIGEAFHLASKLRHKIPIELSQGEAELWNKKAWGPQPDKITISLDAVVEKPDIEKLQ